MTSTSDLTVSFLIWFDIDCSCDICPERVKTGCGVAWLSLTGCARPESNPVGLVPEPEAP